MNYGTSIRAQKHRQVNEIFISKDCVENFLKPSAHSRFLSLIDTKLEALLREMFFKRCVGMILRGKFACQHGEAGLIEYILLAY